MHNWFTETPEHKVGNGPISFRMTLLVIVAVLVFTIVLAVSEHESGPWYLGCSDRYGKEYVLKTEKKPFIKGSLIYLDREMFVVPEPGMTCRIVTVKEVEELQKQAIDK